MAPIIVVLLIIATASSESSLKSLEDVPIPLKNLIKHKFKTSWEKLVKTCPPSPNFYTFLDGYKTFVVNSKTELVNNAKGNPKADWKKLIKNACFSKPDIITIPRYFINIGENCMDKKLKPKDKSNTEKNLLKEICHSIQDLATKEVSEGNKETSEPIPAPFKDLIQNAFKVSWEKLVTKCPPSPPFFSFLHNYKNYFNDIRKQLVKDAKGKPKSDWKKLTEKHCLQSYYTTDIPTLLIDVGEKCFQHKLIVQVKLTAGKDFVKKICSSMQDLAKKDISGGKPSRH